MSPSLRTSSAALLDVERSRTAVSVLRTLPAMCPQITGGAHTTSWVASKAAVRTAA
jgi:hypothetical protein